MAVFSRYCVIIVYQYKCSNIADDCNVPSSNNPYANLWLGLGNVVNKIWFVTAKINFSKSSVIQVPSFLCHPRFQLLSLWYRAQRRTASCYMPKELKSPWCVLLSTLRVLCKLSARSLSAYPLVRWFPKKKNDRLTKQYEERMTFQWFVTNVYIILEVPPRALTVTFFIIIPSLVNPQLHLHLPLILGGG